MRLLSKFGIVPIAGLTVVIAALARIGIGVSTMSSIKTTFSFYALNSTFPDTT